MKYRAWNQERGEVCLGMFDMVNLSMISWLRNFKSWPLVKKFHYLLLRQTLVSEISDTDDLLAMDPTERSTPKIILISWFQNFYVFSIQSAVIILWPVATCVLEDFMDTCWICVGGTWFKMCRVNEFSQALQMCLNGFYVNSPATISQSMNLQRWSLST